MASAVKNKSDKIGTWKIKGPVFHFRLLLIYCLTNWKKKKKKKSRAGVIINITETGQVQSKLLNVLIIFEKGWKFNRP